MEGQGPEEQAVHRHRSVQSGAQGCVWRRGHASTVAPWFGVAFPVATLLSIYILWRSMLAALFHGGIDWRGTRYPLAELKANKV